MKNKAIRILSLIMAVSLILLTFASCKGKDYEKTDPTGTGESSTESTTEAPAATNINPLTGLADLSDSATGARPVAIMVENSPAARPQWGLSTPDIVLEGVVEGGITRMMWIYADVSKVPKVGPVRSARHDYVEIADGMNAIFAHWGGSPQAYDYIKKIGMKDIDGKSIGTNASPSASNTDSYFFFKDNNRTNVATEHRGFTDGKHLAAAIAKFGIETKAKDNNWAPYTFSEGTRASFGTGTGSCSSITLEFSSAYRHTFKYNADTKLYYNYMNNNEMKDGTNGETMAVTNVILVYCPVSAIPGDEKGRQDWDLTSGDAVYVSNGYGESITWKKESKTAPLKFYGKDGKVLTVNKGQTWIGIVPEANRGKTTITE